MFAERMEGFINSNPVQHFFSVWNGVWSNEAARIMCSTNILMFIYLERKWLDYIPLIKKKKGSAHSSVAVAYTGYTAGIYIYIYLSDPLRW